MSYIHNNNKQRANARAENSADSDQEKEEDEDEEEFLADTANNQSSCLHCGELHDEQPEEAEQEEDDESAAASEIDRQLTLSDNAQTCDILDHNLYLRRLFVMPNSLLASIYIFGICVTIARIATFY